jgi:UDP-N-acetylmuramoylalanine--D-glutamate ligase
MNYKFYNNNKNNYFKKKKIEQIKNLLYKKNLSICIWGFGITGKSFLNWAENFLDKSNQYYIIDKNDINLSNIKNSKVTFIQESNKEDYLKTSDFILPSPGILMKKNSSWFYKIISELDIFFYIWKKKLKLKSIIITGSIGKTSVTTMIEHYLSKIKNTILCGNIGYPILNFLTLKNKKNIIAVIECSNVQLEYSVLASPDHFIITNLFKNHLDLHDNSFKKYIKAKLTPLIFNKSKIKKIIIDETTYIQLKNLFLSLLKSIKNKIIFINSNQDIKKKYFKKTIYNNNNNIYYKKIIILKNIPSFSFLINWQFLSSILKKYTFNINNIINKNNLPKLPNFRLQKIIDLPNIIVFNDSKSTVIESSLSALKQIQTIYKDSNIIFFIGGLSKGVNRIPGINKIIEDTHKTILFGKEAFSLKELVEKKNNTTKLISYSTLSDAITNEINKNNFINHTIILFSPGGSSFDEFSSYIDRGEKFNIMINKVL